MSINIRRSGIKWMAVKFYMIELVKNCGNSEFLHGEMILPRKKIFGTSIIYFATNNDTPVSGPQ